MPSTRRYWVSEAITVKSFYNNLLCVWKIAALAAFAPSLLLLLIFFLLTTLIILLIFSVACFQFRDERKWRRKFLSIKQFVYWAQGCTLPVVRHYCLLFLQSPCPFLPNASCLSTSCENIIRNYPRLLYVNTICNASWFC